MDDRFDNRRYFNADTFRVNSTAGAVQIKNEKGELSIQKVKVERYISGKRPGYAKKQSNLETSDNNDSENEDFVSKRESLDIKERKSFHAPQENYTNEDPYKSQPDKLIGHVPENANNEFNQQINDASTNTRDISEENDPRLKRLMAIKREAGAGHGVEKEDQLTNRIIHEPQLLSDGEDNTKSRNQRVVEASDSNTSSDDEDDEDEEESVQRRRDLMRQRALARARVGFGQEELMVKEDEVAVKSENSSSEESSEDETSDSEEEVRCKPVFVRKRDRLTTQEREREEIVLKTLEIEEIRKAEMRRKESLRMVESCVKETLQEEQGNEKEAQALLEIETDDDNEELEYDAWKLRELKRMKKDREDKEGRRREEAETAYRRNMTDAERRQEFRNAPKIVTNKSTKGKYKFMQKYYHKGSFYMEKEENLFKRDFAKATLEDHFDKSVLPKVMQVKNFGRSGRTKYTHLLAQDTTEFDSPWALDTPQNIKFQLNHAAAMKSNFERPSSRAITKNG